MSKENFGIIIVSSFIGLAGFVVMFFSVTFGSSQTDTWLMERSREGTAIYHIIMNSYINTFLVAGSILFGFGLIIVALTYFKLQRIIKD